MTKYTEQKILEPIYLIYFAIIVELMRLDEFKIFAYYQKQCISDGYIFQKNLTTRGINVEFWNNLVICKFPFNIMFNH